MEARKYDVPEMEQMITDPDYAATSDVDRYRNFVPDVHFELIPIKNLVSNQQYQRKLSMRHVESAAAEFNIFEINPVKVSRRDGINYVFDGQHTAEIVAKESGSRDTPVWCMVYDGLDYKLEAYVFANQKKFAKTLTPYEIFMANVEAEEETELTIKALVESYSLTITNKSNSSNSDWTSIRNPSTRPESHPPYRCASRRGTTWSRWRIASWSSPASQQRSLYRYLPSHSLPPTGRCCQSRGCLGGRCPLR